MPGPVSGCTSPRGRAGRRGRPKEERRPEGWPGYWRAGEARPRQLDEGSGGVTQIAGNRQKDNDPEVKCPAAEVVPISPPIFTL
jgi:hypothetical protein